LDPILREAVAKKQAADRDRLAMGVDGGEEKKNEMGDREVQEGETLLDHLVNLTQGGCPSSFKIPRTNYLLSLNMNKTTRFCGMRL
jgi:hypothetical protein